MADSNLDNPKDVNDQLLQMLERNRSIWNGRSANFYVDSVSSDGAYIDAYANKGWHYTVSYKKRIEPLQRLV